MTHRTPAEISATWTRDVRLANLPFDPVDSGTAGPEWKYPDVEHPGRSWWMRNRRTNGVWRRVIKVIDTRCDDESPCLRPHGWWQAGVTDEAPYLVVFDDGTCLAFDAGFAVSEFEETRE